MNDSKSDSPMIHWPAVVAIAAIATSIAVGFHESIHAATCIATGGDLKSYTSLYIDCVSMSVLQGRVVAGSASIANILLGLFILSWLKPSRARAPGLQFFLWLFMLMNLLNGAGYWMISGIANFGDWATVIAGYNPHWVYRFAMAFIGSVTFMGFVALSLKEFGKIIGGNEPELYSRGRKLTLLSYVTALLVVILAGAFSPLGLTGVPAIAGIIAVLGALSPMLWVMEWFHAKMFRKDEKEPLVLYAHWKTIILAAVVVVLYAIVLNLW